MVEIGWIAILEIEPDLHAGTYIYQLNLGR